MFNNERLRSDRTGHKFSLVTFDTGINKKRSTYVRHLEDTIKSRIRFSDIAGWFDERRIAIILPDTSLQGALKPARDICSSLKAVTPQPRSKVYTYPFITCFNGDKLDATSFCQEEVCGNLGDRLIMPRWKRAMDILVSLLGLVILSPLFVSVAVLIRFGSGKPIFFRQSRVGLAGKTFTLMKFRTMNVNSDTTIHRLHSKKFINGGIPEEKPMSKLDRNDSRIIPFGNFLRVTCIDELPQLINVLRGEMSLVGPRPCIPYEAEDYLRWQTRRFDITPGMTGLWQVNGKNMTTFKEMIRYDIQYAAQRSFWLDLKILFNTPRVLISQVLGSLVNPKKDELPEQSKIKMRTAGSMIIKV